MANNTHPEKIVVLGGGTSALTAVYEITNKANWKEDYDITIYQLGWRLGGKGASGRNRKTANRIEEHGLHLWFGFYDNAFDMIQRVEVIHVNADGNGSESGFRNIKFP